MLRAPKMSFARVAVCLLLLGESIALAQPETEPEAEPTPPAEPVEEPPPPVEEPAPAPVEPTPVDVPAPVVEPPPAPTEEQELRVPADLGFAFGSYGRVLAGSDLRGGTPQQVAVVAHAPRIVEPSYVETDLYYRWQTPKQVFVRTVTTLAFGDALFHYTGEFDARPALRNLFLEATTPSGFTLWGGSRMYRGDDIYVFDWWPLDDLNTLGAGLSWHRLQKLRVDLHAGTNRLLDPFQFQETEVADPDFGSQTIPTLDRQRLVTSLAVTHFMDLPNELHAKVKLYGEFQALPRGERRRADDTIENLPRDFGASLGAQLGAWKDNGSHANLFVRWSKGLTAFDELAAPDGLDDSHAAWPGASELTIGIGAAYNLGDRGHIVGGAYTRRFVDADDSTMDRDDGWEYAADIRPEVKISGDVLAGVDLGYQVRFPRGLSPTTLLAADPAVAHVAPMLVYAPFGTRAYDRPQLRLVWRIARLNDAALDTYATDDPRREYATVHFLGVQAEWWFNSSTR
jgi:hypothetical protein